MPLVLKAILLVLGFWLYLTVAFAPLGFLLVGAAVSGHVLRAVRD